MILEGTDKKKNKKKKKIKQKSAINCIDRNIIYKKKKNYVNTYVTEEK